MAYGYDFWRVFRDLCEASNKYKFARYKKSYNNLNVKKCLKLNEKTGGVGAEKFYVPNTTLQVLSRMILINFVALVVFKILLNLVSTQNLLNANNCWHKQNLENCSTWPHIYCQCTFRINYCFYLIFGSLGCRKYC